MLSPLVDVEVVFQYRLVIKMIGTIVLFSMLVIFGVVLYVYAKADTLDPVEWRREKLEHQKDLYKLRHGLLNVENYK